MLHKHSAMERAGLSYYKQHGKREAQGEYRCILCALLTQVGSIGGGGERGNLNTFVVPFFSYLSCFCVIPAVSVVPLAGWFPPAVH